MPTGVLSDLRFSRIVRRMKNQILLAQLATAFTRRVRKLSAPIIVRSTSPHYFVNRASPLFKIFFIQSLGHGSAVAVAALMLGFAGQAEAAVRTWTGLGGTGNWSTSANWDTGAPQNNDSLVFNNGTANSETTNNVVGRTLSSLTFAGSGSGIHLHGNGITLTGGIGASHSVATPIIFLDLTLATNNQTFTLSGSAVLDFFGNVNLNGQNLSVSVTDPANALIFDGVISGAGNITKTLGAGAVYFTGTASNTYVGTTTVNAGLIFAAKSPGVISIPGDVVIGNASATDTLRLGNDNQIAATANVFVNSGGLFDLNGLSNTVASVTFVDGGTVQTLATGELKLGGPVTLNGVGTSASISGHLHLGTSSKTFTVTNTGSALTVSAVIAGGNSGSPFFIAGGVTKSGAGNLILSAANLFAGPVTVNDGTLQVNNNLALGTPGAVSINHDPTTMVNSNAVLLLNNAHVTNEVLTLNSLNTNGALQVNSTGDWIGPIALQTNVFIEASSLLQLGGVISGPGGFTKVNFSTLALVGTGVNTYAGTTTVNGGTLLLSRTGNLGGTIPGALVITAARCGSEQTRKFIPWRKR